MIKEVVFIHLFGGGSHPLLSILTVNSGLCQINLYNKGFHEGLGEEEREWELWWTLSKFIAVLILHCASEWALS